MLSVLCKRGLFNLDEQEQTMFIPSLIFLHLAALMVGKNATTMETKSLLCPC